MKNFSNYQYVDIEPMTERDKREVGSKFWNKGKWDNFIAPFLPQNCQEMTFVDMGCNAGLFLELAEDRGFRRVIGVDANKEAIRRAQTYKEKNGRSYEILYSDIRAVIDRLPAADFTIFSNSHYYLPINDWLYLLDKLRVKTRYCIMVTAEKRRSKYRASGYLTDIYSYFRDWVKAGVKQISSENDPFPRELYGLCFKGYWLDRMPIDSLALTNPGWHHTVYKFWGEIDKGTNTHKTSYFKDLWKNRKRKGWTKNKLEDMVRQKIELFQDIKKHGLKESLIIDNDKLVLDGIHRLEAMRYLGHKSILVRRI